MKIYHCEEEIYDSYKAIFSLDIDFLAIKNLFDVFFFFFQKFVFVKKIKKKNEHNSLLWNFYLDNINMITKINNNSQIYESFYRMYYKNLECTFQEIYIRFSIKNKLFF